MLSAKPWKAEEIVRLMAGIFACLCAFILLQAVVERCVGKDKFNEGALLFLVFNSLSLHGSILLGTALFLWLHRISWGDAFGFSTPGKGRAVLLGVLAALVFLPVGIKLQDLSIKVLTWSHVPTPPQAAVAEFDKTPSMIGRLYLAAFAVIIAPVAEEICFRGFLYATLKQIGYPRFALWCSAIVFALIHLSAPIFLPLLILGLIFVWLYEKTNNLLASITAHSVFNAVNVWFIFYGHYVDDFIRLHWGRGP